jgi:hypothetical protein
MAISVHGRAKLQLTSIDFTGKWSFADVSILVVDQITSSTTGYLTKLIERYRKVSIFDNKLKGLTLHLNLGFALSSCVDIVLLLTSR